MKDPARQEGVSVGREFARSERTSFKRELVLQSRVSQIRHTSDTVVSGGEDVGRLSASIGGPVKFG